MVSTSRNSSSYPRDRLQGINVGFPMQPVRIRQCPDVCEHHPCCVPCQQNLQAPTSFFPLTLCSRSAHKHQATRVVRPQLPMFGKRSTTVLHTGQPLAGAPDPRLHATATRFASVKRVLGYVRSGCALHQTPRTRVPEILAWILGLHLVVKSAVFFFSFVSTEG